MDADVFISELRARGGPRLEQAPRAMQYAEIAAHALTAAGRSVDTRQVTRLLCDLDYRRQVVADVPNPGQAQILTGWGEPDARFAGIIAPVLHVLADWGSSSAGSAVMRATSTIELDERLFAPRALAGPA